MSHQYIIYSFALKDTLNGKLGSGLPSVIAAEIADRKQQPNSTPLTVISTDRESYSLDEYNAQVISANPENLNWEALFDIWFDEYWAYLHPESYTAPALTPQALSYLFQGDYSTQAGTPERVAEHYAKYGASKDHPEDLQQFSENLQNALASVEDGSTIYWQDFFFTNAILATAPTLREKGCKQIIHLHCVIPKELDLFPKGQDFLQAISLMDHVFTHTNTYKERLTALLTKNNLTVPTIERFDLGVDTEHLQKGLSNVTLQNYKTLPDYQESSSSQQQLIDDIFASQDTIPHRFISIDRADPIKGQLPLLNGIAQYLDSLNVDLETLQQQYRFYFIMPYKDMMNQNPYRLHWQYNRYINQLLSQLTEKYPGVIQVSDGAPRSIIPSLLQHAHVMTGGVQDGLNLAVMEGIYVNGLIGADVSAIVGQGAGFALCYPELHGLAFFPEAGSATRITDAIAEIVQLQHSSPGVLKERTKKLADTIAKRQFKLLS